MSQSNTEFVVAQPSNKLNVRLGKEDKLAGFGLYQIKGHRSYQEDTAYWSLLLSEFFNNLSSHEIGYRLWTTYRLLDSIISETNTIHDGTTASTTVYDGKGNLITATLGDSVSFAVVYDGQYNLKSVTRLSSWLHKTENEKKRIKRSGGRISDNRVYNSDGSSIDMSRSIGDAQFKSVGLCADATIDATTIDDILKKSQTAREVAKIQIITTSDGFTEPCNSSAKDVQERYLFDLLQNIKQSVRRAPDQLAMALVGEAYVLKSQDNITVSVQLISLDQAFLIGVYDGHGGVQSSNFVARYIGEIFKRQCQLTLEYRGLENSVHSNLVNYCRDHDISNPLAVLNLVREIIANYKVHLEKIGDDNLVHVYNAVCELNKHLSDPQQIAKSEYEQLTDFYRFLTQKNPDSGMSLDEIIQTDSSPYTQRFLIGIALLASCIFVIPLIYMIYDYCETGRHPFEFFQTDPLYKPYSIAIKALRNVASSIEQNNNNDSDNDVSYHKI